MNYEKKYKEALALARSYYDKDSVNAFLDTIFPELAEGEDERVRKWIASYIHRGVFNEEEHPMALKAIEYLEKQKEQKPAVSREEILHQLFQNGSITLSDYLYLTGEQKPAEWKPQPESLEALKYAIEGKWEMIKPTSYLSRRLEDLYEGLVDNFDVIDELKALKAEIEASMEQKPTELSEEDKTNGWTGVDLERYISCLQRLGTGNPQQPETINSKWFKEHCRPQPKQELSKDDEKMLNKLIWAAHMKSISPRGEMEDRNLYEKYENLLKSLRPSWKPSKEQMKALKYVAYHILPGEEYKDVLFSLFKDLKKLM